MASPYRPPFWQPLRLSQLQRLKNWHYEHRVLHPLECRTWESVMTAWVMGWTGWLPAWTFDSPWAYPLCLLGMLLPQLYVQGRAIAHGSELLRCDWLHLLG